MPVSYTHLDVYKRQVGDSSVAAADTVAAPDSTADWTVGALSLIHI